MATDFTIVLGVDKKTIELLRLVWPTWCANKLSLLTRPMVIFHNYVTVAEISEVLLKPSTNPQGGMYPATFVQWPPQGSGIVYSREGGDPKWNNPQRAKMLAGFVHVPPKYVTTPYWLKLDLDVVAASMDDWINPEWFEGNPSIVAPAWGYTKPPDQIVKLDQWAARSNLEVFKGTKPLNIVPQLRDDGTMKDAVSHSRICSWCAFFSTEFSKVCSSIAEETCGPGQLPVDSQDGFMWYVAARAGFSIKTVRMRKLGWILKSNYNGVKEAAESVLA